MYRILLCKLASLGDCISVTPVISALKKKYPDSHLTVLTSSPYKEVFENNPYIDELKCTPPVTEYWPEGYTLLAYDTYVLNEVKRNRYDKIFNLNTLTFWGEYRRTGVHLSQHYAEMADVYPLNPLKYEIYYDKDKVVEEIMSVCPKILDEDPPIFIHKGGGWGLKTLPEHQWIPIVKDLLYNTTDPIYFIGGKEDGLNDQLKSDINDERVHDITDSLSLKARHFLFERGRLYIGADSGPMHLASAANCPSVVYYSVTSQYVGTPTTDRFITIQSPASCAAPCGLVKCSTHQLCAKLIDPTHILEACYTVLFNPNGKNEHRIGNKKTNHVFSGWENLSLSHDRSDLEKWKDERPYLIDWELNE